jgi:hypothetical protein
LENILLTSTETFSEARENPSWRKPPFVLSFILLYYNSKTSVIFIFRFSLLQHQRLRCRPPYCTRPPSRMFIRGRKEPFLFSIKA